MDVKVTNLVSETTTPLSTAECSSVEEGANVKDLEASGSNATSQNISKSSENSLVSSESCVNDGNPVVLKTGDSNRNSSEPPAEAKATTSQANEGKETESSEGGSKSPGAVADTIKAFENKIKSEEIEMSTFQNPSHGSQPSQSCSDRQEAAMSGDIFNLGKDKISSSTPCLLPSEKVTDTSEKPTVIQKATSSPVLPVIKITQVDENEFEILIPENLGQHESYAEVSQVPVHKPSDISVGASTQSYSSDDIEERSDEKTVKSSDPTVSLAEGSEEQIANTPVQPTVPAENIAPKRTLEDDDEYATRPSVPRPRIISHISVSFNKKILEDYSRRQKCLHIGILMCCIFIVFVALSCYKVAHGEKMEQAYEITAICVAAIVFAVCVFLALYISIQIRFPVIPGTRRNLFREPTPPISPYLRAWYEQYRKISTKESSNGDEEVQEDSIAEPIASEGGDASEAEMVPESNSSNDSPSDVTPSKKDD